jgi:hypothetical protein
MPGILIHILLESLFTSPRNRYPHAPEYAKSGLSRSSVGCIMNTPWRGTPHEATAMRNHRTLIASPLKLSGPCSLIDFGSWHRYPHRLLVITDVLERCKTSGCLYRPLEKCMGLARAKRSLIPHRRNYLRSTAPVPCASWLRLRHLWCFPLTRQRVVNRDFTVRAHSLDDHEIVTLQLLSATKHVGGAFGIAQVS